MSESPFVTYAQNGEDVLLWRALRHVPQGFYIDVGAQDPIDMSVTKAFYEHGWRGINVEPVTHWYQRLVADRPHDINLQVAASNQAGEITLFDIADTGLSTSSAEFAQRHRALGFHIQECRVQRMTLDAIIETQNVTVVHFLKVDCEGAEQAVLEGISLSSVRPWIIVVEATEPLSTTPTWQQWQPLLVDRGYAFVFFDGLNRYYVAQEHSDLASVFDAPVSSLDGAQRFVEVDAAQRIGKLQTQVAALQSAADRARLQAELAAVVREREVARAERDQITAERDVATSERDQLVGRLDAAKAERDRITSERDVAATERDRLASERDGAIAERNRIAVERDGAVAEQRRLQGEQAELLASHSWRLMAPMRACSRALRGGASRLYAGGRALLRPFAHAARPTLKRLAGHAGIRRGVVCVMGRHSRFINTARLFLFGANTFRSMADTSVQMPVPATAHDAALSVRGQEAMALLQVKRAESMGEF